MVTKYLVLICICGCVLSGCVSINEKHLLARGTKIEIMDVSTSSFISTALANSRAEVDMIKNRIMTLTKEQLEELSIEAVLYSDSEAAKLKYDFRTISSGYRVIGTGFSTVGNNRFEVKYRVTLETPDGNKIFNYSDEQDDSDMDDVYEKVAKKVAKIVANRCYR